MSTPTAPGRLPRVAEIVLKAKLIDEMQMKSALREHEKWGGRITRIFNDLKFIPEDKVVMAIAASLKMSSIDLSKIVKDQGALNRIDAALAEEKGIFPIALKDQGKTLWLAMADPSDFQTVEELERKLRARMKLFVAGEKAIKTAIARHYRGITDDRAINTSGALAAASGGGVELDGAPLTTGEYMDAKGEIVGKMRHVTNPRGAPVPSQPSTSALSGFDAVAAGAAADQGHVADELDHLFGMAPAHATPQWSKEDLARLEAARVNQDKGLRVFRAVMELCVEKGLFAPADLTRFRS